MSCHLILSRSEGKIVATIRSDKGVILNQKSFEDEWEAICWFRIFLKDQVDEKC
jgi:hypothetical protein